MARSGLDAFADRRYLVIFLRAQCPGCFGWFKIFHQFSNIQGRQVVNAELAVSSQIRNKLPHIWEEDRNRLKLHEIIQGDAI